jgi:hypothetical protein
MKALLTTGLWLLLACAAWGQGTVTGTIAEKSQTPAPFATVALVKAADSTVVKAKVAEELGTFTFTNVPYGSYRLQITYVLRPHHHRPLRPERGRATGGSG